MTEKREVSKYVETTVFLDINHLVWLIMEPPQQEAWTRALGWEMSGKPDMLGSTVTKGQHT